MRFVKHNDRFRFQLFRNHLRHFRIEHILIIEHQHRRMVNRLPCEIIRTPVFTLSPLFEFFQIVHPRRHGGGFSRFTKPIEILARGSKLRRRRWLLLCLLLWLSQRIRCRLLRPFQRPRRRHRSTRCINRLPIAFPNDAFVNTHVTTRGKTYGEGAISPGSSVVGVGAHVGSILVEFFGTVDSFALLWLCGVGCFIVVVFHDGIVSGQQSRSILFQL
mmetsp:Transcript_30688/g.56827  ORF Transcript_30688/g.56827 Transcript_30688/m.56827 type:complete len:217 (-) Transcript_30688:151-801(-)